MANFAPNNIRAQLDSNGNIIGLTGKSGSTVSLGSGFNISNQQVYVKNYAYLGDDAAAINAADLALNQGGELIFEIGKTYNLSSVVSLKNAGTIRGNGATLKPANAVLNNSANTYAINFSNPKTHYTSGGGLTPFAVVANSQTFTLPANLTPPLVGDLLWFKSNDVYATNTGSTPYYFGQFSTVETVVVDQGTSVATITITTPFLDNYTVQSISHYRGYSKIQIENLTFDLTNTDGNARQYLEGLSMIGTNIEITGCKFIGNQYASCGAGFYGENVTVRNCDIRKFFLTQLLAVGGRTGYGLLFNANNSICENNKFADCKHGFSAGSHYSVAQNLIVRGNTFTEDNSLPYTVSDSSPLFQGSIDFHCGVAGAVVIENNLVYCYAKGLSIRCKSAKITHNTFVQTASDAGDSLIAAYENGWDNLVVEHNDITLCVGPTNPGYLISVSGDYGSADYNDSLKNCSISNNRIKNGSVLRVTRPTYILDNVSINNNVFSGGKTMVDIRPTYNAGNPSGTSLSITRFSLSGNSISACEALFAFHAETVGVQDTWEIKNNRVTAPSDINLVCILIDSSLIGSKSTTLKNINIVNNSLDLNTATGNAYCLTMSSLTFNQLRITGNTFNRGGGGASFRNTTLRIGNYNDVVVQGNIFDTDFSFDSNASSTTTVLSKVIISGNDIRIVAFTEGASSDLRMSGVIVADNNLNGFQYSPRSGTTAWNGSNSTEMLVASNRFSNASGNSVDINVNAVGHKIKFQSNSLNRALSDLSGTFYGQPTGNSMALNTNYALDWKGSTQVLPGGKTIAASAPASGTWVIGDIVYNTAPAAAGYIGWICTAAGTPGTWHQYGAII